MTKRIRTSVATIGILAGACSIAHAQTIRLGGAAVIASDDADARVKNPDSSNSASAIRLPVHAVVYVAPRVGFGVEAMTFGVLTGSVSHTITFDTAQDEHESVIVGTVHARVFVDPRFTIEVVGGAGALRVERTTRATFRFPDSSSSQTTTSSYRALMTGFDAPFRVDRHFSVGPTARVYWLRRDVIQTGSQNSGPSTRFMAGVSASVTW